LLSFTLATPATVEFSVFSVDGRRVRSLISGLQPAGVYRLTWDGLDEARRPAAAGVYYLHLSAGGLRFTRSLVMLR
jgi:hypothetical protein